MWSETTTVTAEPSEVYIGERRFHGVFLVNSGKVPVYVNDAPTVAADNGIRLDPGLLFTWPAPRDDSEVELWAVTAPDAGPGALSVQAPGW